MSLGTIEQGYKRLERKEVQYTTLTVDMGRQEVKVDGQPVSIRNGWLNVWAWVDPVTPYQCQVSRHGGYFQMRNNHWRGIFK